MQNISKKITLSGIQPSGEIHIGNYIGSIKSWKNFQDPTKYQTIFFIADMHALTSRISSDKLKKSVLKTFAIYLASGIDYKESIIFLQSSIKEHANLAWILSCIIQKNKLNKMTQFKSKSLNSTHNVNLGLFTYPMLMASDILLYNADIVPVGDDQTQHIEFTRDIVLSFNDHYNTKYFNMPEFFSNPEFSRIMSLRNAKIKMSKSSDSDLDKISLLETKENIHKKIQKAKTDNLSYISYDQENRPEISNLINIYSAISNDPKEKIIAIYENSDMKTFKDNLSELLINHLSLIQKKYTELMVNTDYLESLISIGNNKAQEIATKNYSNIKNIIGFI